MKQFNILNKSLIIKTLLICVFFISFSLSYCVIPYEIAPNFYLSLPLLFEIVIFAVLLLFNTRKLCLVIIDFFQIKIVKILLLWFLAVCILGVLSSLFGGNAGVLSVILNMLSKILRFIFPLFFGFCFIKLFQNKYTMVLIYTMIFIMLCIGIADLIANLFNITFLQMILKYLANINNLQLNDYNYISIRVKSTFAEPSFFAYFICLFLPYIYIFSFGKYRIYKNKYINFLIKKFFPGFSIVLLLLTKSPIFIAIGFIISVIYYVLMKKMNIKKILFFVFPFVILIILLLYKVLDNTSSIDSTTVMGRILVSIKSIFNLQDLIVAEPSLATRIISYINLFQIFQHNIFLGCGIGNLQSAMANQFLYYSELLTIEIYDKMCNGIVVMNANIFFQLLAESGIIGICLIYTFIYNLYKSLNCLKKNVKGFEKLILQGLIFYVIIFITLSFYDSNIYLSYIWLMFGLIIGYCENVNKRIIKYSTKKFLMF